MLDRFSQLTYDIVNHLQTLVPRSMFLNSSPNLIVGDIVYYKPDNSLLSARWTAGEVVDTKVGKEGFVREVVIKYMNGSEDFYRTTTRAVRSLVKIYPLSDLDFSQQTKEVSKALRKLEDREVSSKLSGPKATKRVRKEKWVTSK